MKNWLETIGYNLSCMGDEATERAMNKHDERSYTLSDALIQTRRIKHQAAVSFENDRCSIACVSFNELPHFSNYSP